MGRPDLDSTSPEAPSVAEELNDQGVEKHGAKRFEEAFDLYTVREGVRRCNNNQAADPLVADPGFLVKLKKAPPPPGFIQTLICDGKGTVNGAFNLKTPLCVFSLKFSFKCVRAWGL